MTKRKRTTTSITLLLICTALTVAGGLMPLHEAVPPGLPLETDLASPSEAPSTPQTNAPPSSAQTSWFRPENKTITQALSFNLLFHFEYFLGFPAGQDGQSWETAYVVEGYNFSQTEATYCIQLLDLPIHVIVRNSSFVGALSLRYIPHARVYNCSFIGFQNWAISASYVESLEIRDNIATTSINTACFYNLATVKNFSLYRNHCTLVNGISQLALCSNGLLFNNTFLTQPNAYFQVLSSSNIQIAHNTLNASKIHVRNTHNSSISDISAAGIDIVNSTNNILTNNQINGFGIRLLNATANFIVNNSMAGYWGLQLKNSHSNTFAFNHIRPDELYSSPDYGANAGIIFMEKYKYELSDTEEKFNSTNNLFYANTIINGNWSVDVKTYGWNNTFTRNTFASPLYAYTIGAALSYWNASDAGNVWGNYTAKYPAATAQFGMWDTPYETEIGQFDQLPLVSVTSTTPLLSASLYVPNEIIYNTTGNTGSFRALGNPPFMGGATAYVFINGLQVQNTTANFAASTPISLDGLDPGDHYVMVTIIGRSGALGLAYSKISVVGSSPMTCVWQTNSQTVNIPALTLEWSPVAEALGYRISVNGVPVASNWGNTNTTHSLSMPAEGFYVIGVVAFNYFGDSPQSAISIFYQIPPVVPEEPAPAPQLEDESWFDGPLGIIIPVLCAASGIGVGLSLGVMLGKKRIIAHPLSPSPAPQTQGGPSPNLPSYMDPNSPSNSRL